MSLNQKKFSSQPEKLSINWLTGFLKANIVLLIILLIFLPGIGFTQVQSNGLPSPTISGENPFLDASTNFNDEVNIGKGLVFPRTDLRIFTFKTGYMDGINFSSAFDGMIIYNTSVGNTLNGQGIVTSVKPGFYYFSNPTGNTSVTNGKWVRLSDHNDLATTPSGISFPVNPAPEAGDVFYRTDIKNYFYFNSLDWIAVSSIQNGTTLPQIGTSKTGETFYLTNSGDASLNAFKIFNGIEWITIGGFTKVSHDATLTGDGNSTALGLADNAVTTSKIADGNITDAKIAAGISASKVGLGNVDNTTDENKPISNATLGALNLKASINSPSLTGIPQAPTANAGNSTLQIATTEFVGTAISNAKTPEATTISTGIIKLAGDLTGTALEPTIGLGKITLEKMATLETASILGRVSPGSGYPEVLTPAQLRNILNVEDGANAYVHPSGDGNLHIPATGTSNEGKVLTAGETEGSALWAAPAVPSGINTSTDATATPFFPAFTANTTGTNQLKTNGSLSYIPSTGVLTANGFAGALTGTVNTSNLKMTGPVYATVRVHSLATNVVWTANDYVIILTNSGISTIFALPDPVTNAGRILCVRNMTGGSCAPLIANGISYPASQANMAAGAGYMFISDGTAWQTMAGR